MNLPRQLYRAEQVRALDRTAIETFRIPGIDLMERAGAATYEAMRQRWPQLRRIAVFCGAGNNGGDGFVIARLASEEGLDVKVFMLTDTERLKSDARLAFEKLQSTGVPVQTHNIDFDSDADIIIDALLGTGLTGEVKDEWRLAIDWINQRRNDGKCKVVAVDIPSGLHADSGNVLGTAIQADLTVTFIGVKQGLLTAQGPDHCGELLFNDLQVDADVYRHVPASVQLIDPELIDEYFPARKRASHKGSYGHVLIVGGNYGMAGSVCMAGEAALRAGAGLVSVACRPEHISAIVSARPELMCHGITSAIQIKALIKGANCIVIGPGLGQDKWAQHLLGCVLESRKPLVVDADALNLLAREPVQRDNWILTPHSAEAGRLLGISASEIQHDRFAAATALQKRYGGVVVLKGNGTLICDNQASLSLCNAGNPGMASGGMGDVLSGVLGACIAQKTMSVDIAVMNDAAKVAVYIHARAADLAADSAGERGLLASDLFPYIRQLVNPS